MALNKALRSHLLEGRRDNLGKHEPEMAEVKVEVQHKDFDQALHELVAKSEALVAIAPDDKKDKLQHLADMYKACADEEESKESPEEEKEEIEKGDDEESDMSDTEKGNNPY